MWKLYKLLDAGVFLCGGEALNLFQTVKEHVNTRDFVEHIGLPVNRSGIPYMNILKMERLYVMMLKRY